MTSTVIIRLHHVACERKRLCMTACTMVMILVLPWHISWPWFTEAWLPKKKTLKMLIYIWLCTYLLFSSNCGVYITAFALHTALGDNVELRYWVWPAPNVSPLFGLLQEEKLFPFQQSRSTVDDPDISCIEWSSYIYTAATLCLRRMEMEIWFNVITARTSITHVVLDLLPFLKTLIFGSAVFVLNTDACVKYTWHCDNNTILWSKGGGISWGWKIS